MPETVIWTLSILGITCSLVLVIFIGRQWRKIRFAEKAKRQLIAQNAHHRDEIKDSLRVLSLALIDDQIDLSEGCIRIKVLLDVVAPALHQDETFSVFNLMYEETSHMPTHEARQEMDKRFRRKLDKQRFTLESEHRIEIKIAAKKLFESLDNM